MILNTGDSSLTLKNETSFFSMSPSDISGCIAYYKFDEGIGSLLYDEISATYNGSIVGAFTGFSTGRLGSSLETQNLSIGQQQAIIYPNNALNSIGSPNNSFSVSCWVNGSNPLNTQQNRIMEKSQSNYPFVIRANQTSGADNAGSIYFAIYDGTNNPSVVGSLLNKNEWYHVVGVRDVFLGSIYLYLNGTLNGSKKDSTTGSINNQGNLYLMNINTARPFNGKLDELAFYDRALTPTEVDILYHLGSFNKMPLSSSKRDISLSGINPNITFNARSSFELSQPVLHMLFDQSGTYIFDTANVHSGLVAGSFIFVPGLIGSAVYCYGEVSKNAGRIDVPSVPDLQLSGDCTIMAWLYPVASTNRNAIISKSPYAEYEWRKEPSNTISAYHGFANGTGSYESFASPKLGLNVWNHMTWVRAGGSQFWYINGGSVIFKKTSLIGPGSIATTSANLVIGYGGVGSCFPGYIDDLRIYNKEITAPEIWLIYNNKAGTQTEYTKQSSIILKGGSQ